MIALVKNHQKIDDMKDRPIVYVKVEEMEPPPPSRFKQLRFEKDAKSVFY